MITELINELWDEQIFCVPILKNGDQIFRPQSYHEYRNNVTKETIPNLPGANGVAVITGYFGLCCIDFDLKNTTDKEIFNKWKTLIYPEILEHCYIESTKSNGYHVFFKCLNFKESRCLAYSFTNEIVIEFYCSNKSIINTYPTDGYKEINNSLFDITPISIEEAKSLVECAKKFNRGTVASKVLEREGKRIIYPHDLKEQLQKYDLTVNPDDMAYMFHRLSGWKYKYIKGKKNDKHQISSRYEFNKPSTERSKPRDAVIFEDSRTLICFTTSQEWFDVPDSWSETDHTAYAVTPTHLLYIYLNKNWDMVEKYIRPKIPFKIQRYLLSKISKFLLKKYIHLYNSPTLGDAEYTIKVDSPLLVFMMWLACPEYKWTSTGSADQTFSIEDCKGVYKPNTRIDTCNGNRVEINEHNYPVNWDIQ